jgi:hypothetical protein
MNDDRPRRTTPRRISLALPEPIEGALRRYVSELPGPVQSSVAVMTILQDWLIGHGYLPAPEESDGNGYHEEPRDDLLPTKRFIDE